MAVDYFQTKGDTTTVPHILKGGTKAVTTAGTRVALVASDTAILSVVIKSNVANTGIIYVGDSLVSSTIGYALSPTDTVSMEIDNLAKVYIDSSVNGEGISFLYIAAQ